MVYDENTSEKGTSTSNPLPEETSTCEVEGNAESLDDQAALEYYRVGNNTPSLNPEENFMENVWCDHNQVCKWENWRMDYD